MEDLFSSPAMAAGYAQSRPPVHPQILNRIRATLQITTPLPTALDIGCGAGLSTKPLTALAQHTYGIDPFHAMLRQATLTAPEAHFITSAAEALPFRQQSIHLITAAGSLNYTNLNAFFPEATRVLLPDGALVVYDFSQGRRFTNSPKLEDWFETFRARYPAPPNSGRPLSVTILASIATSFKLSAHEEFDTPIPLTISAYVKYIMTETNIAHAIRNGVSADEIRAWLNETLAPVFEERTQQVLFPGYIAYLSRADARAADGHKAAPKSCR